MSQTHYGILGRKVGMTQIYNEDGVLIPVTVIDTSGCSITQVKHHDKDGYSALQLAVGTRKPQNINKAKAGHLKKANVAPKAFFQELRFADGTDMAGFKAGQELTPEMFEKGDKVDVSGITIGKGFAGVMKKYGFHGKPATHGTSKHFRHGGSIGTATYPGRVLKNKKMPSRMGNVLRTIQNIEVVEVRGEENLLILKGGIPGSKQGYVEIRSAIKKTLPSGRSWVKGGKEDKAADAKAETAEAAPEAAPQDK